MLSKPKVSIIIPVYNPPIHFLEQFYSSIKNQSLHEIEIIFIDDNSDTYVGNFLLAIGSKDNRVINIKNETNLRAGISRKKGLDIAQGEYVLFADCDDFLNINTCEVLYNKALSNNADIVYSSYNVFSSTNELKYTQEFEEVKYILNDKTQCLKAFRANNNALWNKLFKAEIIKEINFSVFDVNIGEDRVFNIAAFIQAKIILLTEFISYNYILHESSATGTNNKGVKYLKVFKESEMQITELIRKSRFDYLNKRDIGRRYSNVFIYGLDWIRDETDKSSQKMMWEYWKLYLEQNVLPNSNWIQKFFLYTIKISCSF